MIAEVFQTACLCSHEKEKLRCLVPALGDLLVGVIGTPTHERTYRPKWAETGRFGPIQAEHVHMCEILEKSRTRERARKGNSLLGGPASGTHNRREFGAHTRRVWCFSRICNGSCAPGSLKPVDRVINPRRRPRQGLCRARPCVMDAGPQLRSGLIETAL